MLFGYMKYRLAEPCVFFIVFTNKPLFKIEHVAINKSGRVYIFLYFTTGYNNVVFGNFEFFSHCC